jgi:hypothetical protein
MGALLARAYYTPGIIELMEALVIGSITGQSSFPWQVAIPQEMANAKYGDLVQAFLADGSNALCMGLYRSCWPGAGDGAKYVMTNPPLNTALRGDDLAIVLGSEDFGKDAFARGLLVTATGAPGCDEEWLPEAPRLTRQGSKSQAAKEQEAVEAFNDIGVGGVSRSYVNPRSTGNLEELNFEKEYDTGDIPEEKHLPTMSSTQHELNKAQEELAERREREMAFRARLREQEDELSNARMNQAALEARLKSMECGPSTPAPATPAYGSLTWPFTPSSSDVAGGAPVANGAGLPVSPAVCGCRTGPSVVTQTITK